MENNRDNIIDENIKICSYCLIIFKKHNPHKTDDKYIIKVEKNIDLDGNDIDKIYYFICVICKNVYNINKCYVFL